MKKVQFIALIIFTALHIQPITPAQTIIETTSTQSPSEMLVSMLQAIEFDDQASFEQLLKNYIYTFGQLYEKQDGILGAYKTIYFITSKDDQSQPLTPSENKTLLDLLNKAALHDNWKSQVILRLSVFNPKTLLSQVTSFHLDEIITAIQRINQPPQFSQTQIAIAATLGALALGGGLYYFAQRNPEWIQQTSDSIRYGWQDLQDSTNHMFKKYITGPQNYEQFEKEYHLSSDDMTNLERQLRFNKWQKEQEIAYNRENKIKELERFEKQHNLSSENMNIDDRFAVFKTTKKEERDLQRLHKKMQPVEQFEKKHSLLSEEMSDKDRQKRFQEWQQGDRNEKRMQAKMKEVKAFEKQHKLISENMAEDSRLQRFKEFQRGQLKQKAIDDQLKIVAAWEKQTNISPRDMHYEDRIKRYKEAQQTAAHEKFMHGLEQWEQENASWLNHKNYKWNYYKGTWEEDTPVVLSENERIQQYMKHSNPFERYAFENNLIRQQS